MLFFLIWGLHDLRGPKDLNSLLDLGFGTVSEAALINTRKLTFGNNDSRVILSVLLANIPQFLFSGLYFQYNALFTGMLAAREWSDFGDLRRGLRVSSDPKGDQRSRYFLQLPYRWSISLLFTSILIHWMLSQSIFVVAVDKSTDPEMILGPVSDTTLYSTCGYSPIAIIAVVTTSLAMVSVVVFTGCRTLPNAIPVVGSCSLAIAASCHQPNGTPQPEEALAPLQWGVMYSYEEGTGEENLGHCGFSSEYVEDPQEGVEYS